MERYAFDLHLHSCLSPCGGEDNTPANLAGMCALAGLEVAALTDHNTTGNCTAFQRAARRNGLLAVPGMELTTREAVHVVCLLPDLEAASRFDAYVRSRLPDIPNDPDNFGDQLLMDDESGILGRETAFLAGAADIGIYEVSALVDTYGGVAFPAHIDRPAFSLLGNLGLWDPDMGFSLAEITSHCPPSLRQRPDLREAPMIVNCDAHYLDQIPDAHQYMDLPRLTVQEVLQWLRRGCQ